MSPKTIEDFVHWFNLPLIGFTQFNLNDSLNGSFDLFSDWPSIAETLACNYHLSRLLPVSCLWSRWHFTSPAHLLLCLKQVFPLMASKTTGSTSTDLQELAAELSSLDRRCGFTLMKMQPPWRKVLVEDRFILPWSLFTFIPAIKCFNGRGFLTLD